jgi:hypothetical protein
VCSSDLNVSVIDTSKEAVVATVPVQSSQLKRVVLSCLPKRATMFAVNS